MINLMHGDCLELMKDIPDGSVDMILTDPPYGMSFQSNHRKEKHKKIEGDNSLLWLNDLIDESYRIASPDSVLYFFCSFHKIDIFKQAIQRKFKVKNLLVWEKNNTSMGDLKGDFAPKLEFCFFAQKGRVNIRGKRDPNIFKFARTKNELHPTQKPLDMMEYLISKFSDEEMTVCDPFMGSGTTGVACVNTGRKFIGMEMDEKYFEIASKRIEEANG